LIKPYRSKQLSPEEAIKAYINPGDRIFIDSGCSEPLDLTQKLIELGPKLPDTEILHFISLSDLDYYKSAGGKEDLFRHNVFFISNNLREAVKKGFADYTPMLLSDIPRLFERGLIHVKTALIQVSRPDQHGFCSYGINVDIAKSIAESAEYIIAEINPNMPRTLGNSFIHMDKIDAFIISCHEVIEFKYGKPNKSAKKIGKYVASLIEDESTIQMGIGTIPNAITKELEDKKDLGIHSEVFSDGILDLVEKGVVTCRKKTIHKGKIIASFIMGSRKLYNFVDNNSFIEFHPVNYCNDPYIIGKNKKQVAINAALSVDLTGQVNADSLGPLFYSGIGGQVDFVRGANRSIGGKPITVLPSTATHKDGKIVSRIVPFLQPGSGVVITRGDVHYVVTEWGIAYLHGKSIRERVLQMIGIAHPDFREELLEYAKKWKYVYSDQKLPHTVDGRVSVYPEKYVKELVLKNGRKITVRPVKPSDERLIQELYYSLGNKDRYLRFFAARRSFRHELVQKLTIIDYSTNMILIGEDWENGEKKIVASAAFIKTKSPSTAEISIVVNKKWRMNGLAKSLLKYLIDIGRELNYKYFSGTILLENKPMLHILHDVGYPLVSKEVSYGEVDFKFDITTKQ
jgi:acyl-CoA hydrolase